MLRLVFRNIFFLTVFIFMTVLISLSVIGLSRFRKTELLRRRLELIWAKSAVFASGVELQALQLPTLDPKQNYIFISNHQSHLDIPIILSLFDSFFPRFLAKESLFRIPVFGPGMRNTGHLTVDRENRRQGMKDLQVAVDKAQSGESVLVFPEGTRNTTANLQDFQSGAFILVVKSNLPMVPVIIDGSRDVLPKGTVFVRPGRVRIKALDPLDWAGKYTLKERDRLKRELWELMQNEYLELQQWDKQNQQ